MTKKILALALAGTTAFSVFAGALSVNAAEPSFTAAYDAPALAISGSAGSYVLSIGGTDLSNSSFNTLKEAVAALVVNEDYSEVEDVEIENGKVYLLDYELDGDTEGKGNTDDREALQEVLDTIAGMTAFVADAEDNYSSAKIVNTISTAVKNYLKDDGAAFTPYQNQGNSGSFRRTVYDAFKDLDPSDADNFEKNDDNEVPYGYEDLVTVIDGVDPLIYQTSEMMYLIQEYNRIIELLDPADSSSAEDQIERYTSILDARSSDDYKNAYSFTSFLAEYEKLQADYASATTTVKLIEYAGKLETLILKNTGTSAGVDKTDLETLIDTADDLDRADYTKVLDDWNYFIEIRDEAKAVKARGKSYSYQSTVDAYVELLSEAMDALNPNSSVSDWEMLRLETAVTDAEALVETDYSSASWKKLQTALTAAQNVLESNRPSKTAINNAWSNLDTALRGLNAKKPSATLKKELKNAIEDAQDALDNLDSSASGYQANALTKAINEAKELFTDNTMNTLDATVSEVENAITALEAAMTSAAQPQGWYTTAEGKWMYGEGDGYYVDGWKKIGNFWFFFNADGTAKQNEWFQDGSNWYYCGNSCVAYSGWGKVDGSWYYFSKANVMCTGWIRPSNSYYYLNPTSGKMVTGWAQIGGKWYYFSTDSNNLGAMLTSTTTPDGYQVGADGAMI